MILTRRPLIASLSAVLVAPVMAIFAALDAPRLITLTGTDKFGPWLMTVHAKDGIQRVLRFPNDSADVRISTPRGGVTSMALAHHGAELFYDNALDVLCLSYDTAYLTNPEFSRPAHEWVQV